MLKDAIEKNQAREARRNRAERVLRSVRRQFFDYEDAGKGEKAQRVILTCKRILTPRWEAHAASRRANANHWMYAAE